MSTAKLATFESQKEVVCRTDLWNLKKERLRHRNQHDRDRHAAESAQQRRVLGYRRGRLASETPDQSTSHLKLGRA